MQKKVIIFLILIFLIISFCAFSLYARSIKAEEFVSLEEYSNFTEEQKAQIAECLSTSINSNLLPLKAEKIASDEVLAFSASSIKAEDNQNSYMVNLNFKWGKEIATKNDIFFFGFNDDQGLKMSKISLYMDGITTQDRPINLTFSGAVFELDNNHLEEGTVTFEIKELVPNPSREVLMGYIHMPSYYNFLPRINVLDYPFEPNTKIKIEKISF